ncbi:MAG: DUF6427 family protein, partial [Bacteroidota bacterium]
MPYAFILRAPAFFYGESWIGVDMGLSSTSFFNWSNSALFESLLSILLVFFQAVLINRIVIINRLSNGIHLFSGLFYILFMSFIPETYYLSPVLLGNTFVILSITELFYAYKKQEASGKIYNAGLWLGIAVLFYAPNLFLLAFGIIGISVLRVFKFKEMFQFFIGFLNVVILLGVYSFWKHGSLIYLSSFLNYTDLFNLKFSFQFYEIIKLVLFIIIVTICIVSYSK